MTTVISTESRLPEWFVGGPWHGRDKLAGRLREVSYGWVIARWIAPEDVKAHLTSFDPDVESTLPAPRECRYEVKKFAMFGTVLRLWVDSSLSEQDMGVLLVELLLAPHRVPAEETVGSADDQALDLDRWVRFIRAQLDEDERGAAAAWPGPWTPSIEEEEVIAKWSDLDQSFDFDDPMRVCDGFALSGHQLRATTRHIARQDPERTLLEVEAKRALLNEVIRALHDDPTDETAQWMLQALAKPYRQELDYPG